jgi:hypothetical protein
MTMMVSTMAAASPRDGNDGVDDGGRVTQGRQRRCRRWRPRHPGTTTTTSTMAAALLRDDNDGRVTQR